jgi:hypothetical protein
MTYAAEPHVKHHNDALQQAVLPAASSTTNKLLTPMAGCIRQCLVAAELLLTAKSTLTAACGPPQNSKP